MRRRDLVALIIGAAAPWVLIATVAADPVAGKLALIGVLANAPVTPLDGLREGLRDLGYVEGENLRLEYHWAEGRYDRYPDLAAELVALPVDAIVTVTTSAALAAQRTTSRIPIIMAAIGDAISAGLVSNLAHPGGNITGFSSLAPDLVVKQVEFLKELVPTLARLVVLSNTTNPMLSWSLSACSLLRSRSGSGCRSYRRAITTSSMRYWRLSEGKASMGFSSSMINSFLVGATAS